MQNKPDLQISQGLTEDGIVVGNAFDKYGSGNPIVNWIMRGFHESVDELVTLANPDSIHEIGCGEGYWAIKWKTQGKNARGSDFSTQVIELAKENADQASVPPDIFSQRSIYDLTAETDSADLIVCCEVLEHLEEPEKALEILTDLSAQHFIFSVPREPLWCALNMARGKYLGQLGNTPGHIQHWSRSSFRKLIQRYFEVLTVRSPLPWTMILCRPKSHSMK